MVMIWKDDPDRTEIHPTNHFPTLLPVGTVGTLKWPRWAFVIIAHSVVDNWVTSQSRTHSRKPAGSQFFDSSLSRKKVEKLKWPIHPLLGRHEVYPNKSGIHPTNSWVSRGIRGILIVIQRVTPSRASDPNLKYLVYITAVGKPHKRGAPPRRLTRNTLPF